MGLVESFAELGRLLERDERFALIAQDVAVALSAMNEEELAALQSDESEREQIFQEIWDEFVEPADRSGSDLTYATWQMSMEGVVIDDVIRLWTAGPDWRQRVKALIPPTNGQS
jgi:hypothetical protein